MDEKVVNNLKSESRWLRLAFMLVFAVVAYLAACWRLPRLCMVFSPVNPISGC